MAVQAQGLHGMVYEARLCAGCMLSVHWLVQQAVHYQLQCMADVPRSPSACAPCEQGHNIHSSSTSGTQRYGGCSTMPAVSTAQHRSPSVYERLGLTLTCTKCKRRSVPACTQHTAAYIRCCSVLRVCIAQHSAGCCVPWCLCHHKTGTRGVLHCASSAQPTRLRS